MKILIIMDPGITVPPIGYGGHERLVEMFAIEYLSLGHSVDLLVTKGSDVHGCKIISIGPEGFPASKSTRLFSIFRAWLFLMVNHKNYDLIHNYGRLIYLLPILNTSVKKIMTYGREINSRNIKFINRLPNKNIVFTGCSGDLISRVNAGGKWVVIYNAVPFEKYQLIEKIDLDIAPYMFLGRIERIKGLHNAIKVCKITNSKLIIAGNISSLKEEQHYFETEILPNIDGVQINYVGALNDSEKNFYLSRSKALLFPIEWNEPFGMVMAEAMACGTPVIGFQRGSVSEVIDEGITGFKVKDIDGMVKAMHKIQLINRKKCREVAERRFSVSRITKDYLNLFDVN